MTSSVQVVKKPFYKCQWALCDRVLVGFEDLRTHVLDVHVDGFDEEDGEDEGEVSVQTLKKNEQSIEQVNRMNPIESTLSEIVSDGQSCASSHDHAYDHQIDHLPSAPLNVSASLICSFAECVDLTFNHRPSLLRHTRLKHSQSLHPIHCKPFTNVRRPAQSNHVLKIVVTDKMACSLCDKWFQLQDDLEIHVIQEHTVRTVVTGGFGEFSKTFENDEKFVRHLEVDPQQELQDIIKLRPGEHSHDSHDVGESEMDSDGTNSYKKSSGELDIREGSQQQQLLHQVIELNESTIQSSFNCPECVKSFRNKRSVKAHHRQVHPKQVFYCEVSGCDKWFKTIADIVRHYRRMKAHRKVNLPCDQCKMFRKNKDFQVHLQTHHSICFDPQQPRNQVTELSKLTNQSSVNCLECDKSFKKKTIFL